MKSFKKKAVVAFILGLLVGVVVFLAVNGAYSVDGTELMTPAPCPGCHSV